MNLEPLYDYQKENARALLNLLSTRGSGADRSDMGTGKTFTACVVARVLGLDTIVVSPKSVIPSWKAAAEATGFAASLITNYESIRAKTQFWDQRPPSLIIFDEAHKLRRRGTQQTNLLIKAREKGHKILLLSATLVGSSLDLYGIGYALGLFASPRHWWGYARRYGGFINRWGGYDASTDDRHLRALSEVLDQVSVRTRITDLQIDLPCVTSCDLIDCPAVSLRDIIEEVYKEAEEEGDQNKYDAAHLVARGRARKEQERAKIAFLVTETQDLVSRGYSVVVFLSFDDSLWDFYTQFKDISVIAGGQSEAMREENISNFQSNIHKVLVTNIKAGGVGLSLHDTTGKHPRVSFISPPESAIDLLQALGRIRRVGMVGAANNRIVCASSGVDRRVYNQVSKKLRNIQLINDSDLEYEVDY